MIEIPVGNKEFRLFHFLRADGRGQLNADETIQSATVTVTNAATGEAVAGLVSQVAPYDSTAVRYFVDPGAANLTPRARIDLTFTVATSNGQTLTDTLPIAIM